MKNKLLLLYIFIFLGPLIASASCPGDTARFTSTAGACKNKTISFVNTSVGAITTYFWDFGDGSTLSDTSLLQNPPAYTYPVLGNYTATLIINKGLLCADTFTALVNMSFVVANFTHNAPTCITDSVDFTDVSTIGPGSTITNWLWTFGDPGSGINNTSTLQNPSHLYSAGNQTFSAKLVTTTSTGCKDSISISIGIQNAVVTNAGTDIISCNNNLTVNLSGSVLNAGGASWSGSGTFSNPTSLTPIYTPTSAAKASGTDTVILTSFSPAFCQNVSDTVILIFNPGPTVNIGPDFSVCKDTSGVPLSAVITGATGVTWGATSVEGTFGSTINPNTIYFPSTGDTASGSVIIYIQTTGNGICLAATDSVTITFMPLPTVIIKTEDSTCSGNAIILDVTVSTGAGTWSSSGSGTFIPNATTLNGVYYPSAADNLAGNVTLYFDSGNNAGCQQVSDTLDIVIKPSPTAAFTFISACEGADVVFTDASSPSGTIAAWNWLFGDLSLPGFSPSPTHDYSSCGSKNVTLVVTAQNGCIDSNIQAVVVYCLPVANYTAIGVCLNTGTAFSSTSTVEGATITSTNWNFGDNTTSTIPNPTHSFSASGSFPVSLVVQSSEGCSDSITQTVSLVSGPVAAFTVSDATIDAGDVITFYDGSTGAANLFWNFEGISPAWLQTNTGVNPTHLYNVGGEYNACLIAEDAFGCMDTTCQQMIVATSPVGPTGFSPNGDGENDVFYVYGGPFKTLEFRIYNNWGELVFESNTQTIGWDGKFKGIDQAVGVYVYTVVGVTEDDFKYRLSGDVTLLR